MSTEPEHLAHRLIHDIDGGGLGVSDRIALAAVLAALAQARATHTANLIALLPYAEDMHPNGRAMLLAVLRRRSRLFPHQATDHGHTPNGGT